MSDFQDIQQLINQAILNFDKSIPSAQREMLDKINAELHNLDLTSSGTIEVSSDNIQVLTKIKSQLNDLVLTNSYLSNVQDFITVFNQVGVLQNEYWKTVEATFKPPALLEELKKTTINTTLDSLTEIGIGANITDEISKILQTNITSGGSFKKLQDQLKVALTNSGAAPGLLHRYTSQITTDALNQYSANYTKVVSDDLGFEWYAYRNSDLMTTRPFCDAMTDFRYFHISQVPQLLQANNCGEPLTYLNKKTGEREKVPMYNKTGLPQGMPEDENAANFFIYRGGYNCGHQTQPVPEQNVPVSIKEKVINTPEYKAWQAVKKGAQPTAAQAPAAATILGAT